MVIVSTVPALSPIAAPHGDAVRYSRHKIATISEHTGNILGHERAAVNAATPGVIV
jgi:hypothetical protein